MAKKTQQPEMLQKRCKNQLSALAKKTQHREILRLPGNLHKRW